MLPIKQEGRGPLLILNADSYTIFFMKQGAKAWMDLAGLG
jgi:hypothetical protein